MAKSFDLLIIGAGQGVAPILEAAEKAGCHIAVAERGLVGGSCVNFGCTPTKAVLASAHLAHLARRAADFGIEIPTVRPNFGEVLSLARKLVAESRLANEKWLGERLLRGSARFVGREEEGYRLLVGDREVLARRVVIGTGSRSRIPKIEGLERVPYVTAENWIEATDLPPRIAMIGGGYIAVEMGQFYRRMGAEVTIIDPGEHPLGSEDADVAGAVRTALEAEGVRFLMGMKFDRVVPEGEAWRLTCGGEELVADEIFVATGRQLNTEDLGLEVIGVDVDAKSGAIVVDDHLRTSAPDVFAIGDVRGGPMFTHTAWDDGRIVADLLFGTGKRSTRRNVPYAVFTHPELGRVGSSEKELKAQGKRYRTARFDMKHNGRAQEERETQGFVKLFIEEDSDKFLGAAVVSEQAAETIHIVAAIMQSGGTANDLIDMLAVHPTYSEGVQNALV